MSDKKKPDPIITKQEEVDQSEAASDMSPVKVLEAVNQNILPANPLLPKVVHPEQKEPPQCPLKDIQFVQLQRFRKFYQ